MKYLIAGLGNIGPEYANTRHNAGFLVVDRLAEIKGVSFQPAKLGHIARVKHRGRTLLLLKPNTYMNLSGKAVRYWMQKEKIPVERVIVVVDDLHIDFGRFRLRPKGSDGGHNGLKDIQQALGRTDFARLRFGIGNAFPKSKQVDYVLGEWTGEEKEQLAGLVDVAARAVLDIPVEGIARVMARLNQRK